MHSIHTIIHLLLPSHRAIHQQFISVKSRISLPTRETRKPARCKAIVNHSITTQGNPGAHCGGLCMPRTRTATCFCAQGACFGQQKDDGNDQVKIIAYRTNDCCRYPNFQLNHEHVAAHLEDQQMQWLPNCIPRVVPMATAAGS